MAPKKEFLTWEALEYPEKNRSTDWFWGVGIVVVTVLVLSIIFDNFLFGVFIFLMGVIVVIRAIKKPGIISFGIGPSGIRVDNNLYPFKTFSAFWVEERGLTTRVILKSNKPLMPFLSLPLSYVNPDDVREVLFDYLVEEEMHEGISARLFDYFGL